MAEDGERFLCITPDGALVVMSGKSDQPHGCCPFCREMLFRKDKAGWLECSSGECGFRVLQSDATKPSEASGAIEISE